MPVTVSETKSTGRISVRVAPEDAPQLTEALGLELPDRIGTRTTEGGCDALCVGPDEWTMTLPEADVAGVMNAVDGAEVTASAVDISHRETTLAISGDETDTLLSMGCPIDLDTVAVGGGTRTLFAGVPVTLWRDSKALIRMDVWRSFAPQVQHILTEGQEELAAERRLRAA